MSIKVSEATLVGKWYCEVIEQVRHFVQAGFYFSKRTDLRSSLVGDGQLSDDDRDYLAVKYYNIRNRLPTQRKREVHICRGVNCPPNLQSGFEMLKRELKEGSNLLPRMSRATKDLDASDGMLNDWGIQHFHLGMVPDKKYPDLVQGDKFIAYVYMTEDDAFVITIDDHGKWGEKCLLEKLLADFPHVLDDWKTDAHELSFEADGKDRDSLRKAHINMGVILNGTVYMRPYGGDAMDGSSVNAVWNFLQDRKFLVKVCDGVKNILGSCGWGEVDFINSRLLDFRRGREWFVHLEKEGGTSSVLIFHNEGQVIARCFLPVSC